MRVPWPSGERMSSPEWSDVDRFVGLLRGERGICEQNVDNTKTQELRKSLAIAGELLERLKLWKQTTEFPGNDDLDFP
jgi:hypothetical protein